MPSEPTQEWIYQLQRIAPKVYAKQAMALAEVLEFLQSKLAAESLEVTS